MSWTAYERTGLPQAIARNDPPAVANPSFGGGGGEDELGPPQADGSFKLFVAQLPYDVAKGARESP